MMNLNKEELKVLAEIIHNDIIKESANYNGALDVYKESKNYKAKSKLYTIVQSEYFGIEITINEDSIFGLLDIG